MYNPNFQQEIKQKKLIQTVFQQLTQLKLGAGDGGLGIKNISKIPKVGLSSILVDN